MPAAKRITVKPRFLTDSEREKQNNIRRAEREMLVRERLEFRRKRKTDECKIETVKTYLLLGGNLTLTAATTGISRNTLKVWKASKWWANVVEQLRKEEKLELSARTRDIVNKSLALMAERLENGDYIYDGKQGILVRKPVPAKELNVIAKDMLKQKEWLDKSIESNEKPESHMDKLEKLAEQFAQLAISAVQKPQQQINVTDVIFAEEVKDAPNEERKA